MAGETTIKIAQSAVSTGSKALPALANDVADPMMNEAILERMAGEEAAKKIAWLALLENSGKAVTKQGLIRLFAGRALAILSGPVGWIAGALSTAATLYWDYKAARFEQDAALQLGARLVIGDPKTDIDPFRLPTNSKVTPISLPTPLTEEMQLAPPKKKKEPIGDPVADLRAIGDPGAFPGKNPLEDLNEEERQRLRNGRKVLKSRLEGEKEVRTIYRPGDASGTVWVERRVVQFPGEAESGHASCVGAIAGHETVNHWVREGKNIPEKEFDAEAEKLWRENRNASISLFLTAARHTVLEWEEKYDNPPPNLGAVRRFLGLSDFNANREQLEEDVRFFESAGYKPLAEAIRRRLQGWAMVRGDEFELRLFSAFSISEGIKYVGDLMEWIKEAHPSREQIAQEIGEVREVKNEQFPLNREKLPLSKWVGVRYAIVCLALEPPDEISQDTINDLLTLVGLGSVQSAKGVLEADIQALERVGMTEKADTLHRWLGILNQQ